MKSSGAQAMTKGEVSLALAGTGRGWDLGSLLRQVHHQARQVITPSLSALASGFGVRDWPRQAVNSAPNRNICAE